MILEKQSQSVIYETGAAKDSIGMSLDLDSAQVLMQMLSKNLYSDAIGSTVRECASNALDSHRRAGTTDPIIVAFKNAVGSSNYEFSVEDFGIGLDADDVEKIISKYGKSTKRDSDTELGMMGLGFKAPLAYSSSFYFTCRKDGMERKYMMYEGEDTNTIDLLYEKPTAERNGVKVVIPVKYSDKYDFKEKIREQLAYFQNVYFDVEGIDNSFSIYRGTNYQVSEIATDSHMHICLDDVYYPIDWKKIEISPINVPVGLRFSLTDGLFPTPNRESIRYTPEAKQKIKDKIKAVADEFVNSYNDTVKDAADFETVYSFFHSDVIQVKNPTGDKKWFDISNLVKHSSLGVKKPKLANTKLINTELIVKRSNYILQEYEYRHRLYKSWNKTMFQNYTNTWDRQITFSRYGKTFAERTTYLFESNVPERTRRYLKEMHSGNEIFFVKKVKDIPLLSKTNSESRYNANDYSCYYGLLNLYSYPKSQWRDVIKEFQEIVKDITSTFLDFDSIVIPEAWIIADKKKRTKAKPKVAGTGEIKEKGDITGKIAAELERYLNGQNCKFVPYVWKGDKLHLTKKLVVYGKDSDKEQLDKFYGFLKNEVTFVILSDRETKVLESYNLTNWMTISKFAEGKSQPYRRAVSTSLIRNLQTEFKYIFSNVNGPHTICTTIRGLKEDVDELNQYHRKHKTSYYMPIEMTNKAIEDGNVDPNIHHVYLRVKKFLSTFRFIETIQSDFSFHNSSVYNSMLEDLCRYNKIRMSIDKYHITEGWLAVDKDGQLSLFVA